MSGGLLQRVNRLIATAGGLGYSPWAPGTVASCATAALWCAVPLADGAQWLVGAGIALVGFVAAGAVARDCGEEDPSCVVVDEVAGMWLALAGHPRSVLSVGVALTAFRILDVVKPPPIRQLERLRGGFGIMADDLAAGLVAHALTSLIVSFCIGRFC